MQTGRGTGSRVNRQRGTAGWSGQVAGMAALLLCAGCIARYVRIEQKGLTCGEAQQIAIETVHKLGYHIDDVSKPGLNAPGMIAASREEGTDKRSMLVQVFCTTAGAAVEAKAEGGGLAEFSLPSEFKRTFETAAATRPPVRAPAEKGLDVLLTPERGNVAAVGVDLNDLGILPVSVRITNNTPRTYHFTTREVVLQTADGDRVEPSSVASISAQLPPASVDALRQKTLADRDIHPNETVNGLLLFPFNAYARARVVLIDRASDEPEGFSIEF